MVVPFVWVVDYVTYRLTTLNQVPYRRESIYMSHLTQEVEGLHPTIECSDGTQPVRFLSLPTIMGEIFDTLGTSEAAAVRVLASFCARLQRCTFGEVLVSQVQLWRSDLGDL